MRKLLTDWDQDLRRLAERLTPLERIQLTRHWSLPLLAVLGAVVIPLEILGASQVTKSVVISIVGGGALLAYGILCARLSTHGQRHDRTTPWQPWHSTEQGRLFLKSLEAFPAENLRKLNLNTELYQGLGLSGDHLQGFLADLAAHCGVERLPVGDGPFAPCDGVSPLERFHQSKRDYSSLTVARVLDAMSQAKRQGGGASSL